jgi:hypothetical protein
MKRKPIVRSDDERRKLLQRANEIGMTAAAKEAGTSSAAIYRWTTLEKFAGIYRGSGVKAMLKYKPRDTL